MTSRCLPSLLSFFYPYSALLPLSFRLKTYQRLETCRVSSLCCQMDIKKSISVMKRSLFLKKTYQWLETLRLELLLLSSPFRHVECWCHRCCCCCPRCFATLRRPKKYYKTYQRLLLTSPFWHIEWVVGWWACWWCLCLVIASRSRWVNCGS